MEQAQRQATLRRPFVQFPAVSCDTISDLPTLQPCWFRHTLFDTEWVRISGDCSESQEFPASSCQGCVFTARFSPRTQNWNVQAVLFCWLTVRHCLLTILHYCTFKLTNVDCSSLIYVTSDTVSWSCSWNMIAPSKSYALLIIIIVSITSSEI